MDNAREWATKTILQNVLAPANAGQKILGKGKKGRRDYMTTIPPPAGGQANGNANQAIVPRTELFKKELERWKPTIKTLLPTHVPIERFMKVAARALLENPQLIECTVKSLVKAVAICAEFGLDPSPLLGECAFVPFNNKVKVKDGNQWVERTQKEVQVMPQYGGLIKLVKQTGEVADVYAVVVDESEYPPTFDENGKHTLGFYVEEGTTREIHHIRKMTDLKGNLFAVYGVVKFKDNTHHFEVLTRSEVEAVRKRSKTPEKGPWVDDFNEMAKKTAIKRTLKTVPKSAEKADRLVKAVAGDNAVEIGDVFNTEGTEAIDTTGEVVDDKPADPQPTGPTQAAPPTNSKTSKLGATLAQTPTGTPYDQGTGEVKS